MKAITTLVIRNSQLEDLHASGPVNAGGITAITTSGLGPLSHLIAAGRRNPLPAGPAGDPFEGLAALTRGRGRASLRCGPPWSVAAAGLVTGCRRRRFPPCRRKAR
jgi:hypothetical protein